MLLGIFLVSLACGLSAAASAALIPRVVKFAVDNRLFDLPGVRKVHTTPVPRLGGVGFLPVSVLVFAIVCLVPFRSGANVLEMFSVFDIQHLMAFIVGAFLLYACGVMDDVNGLSYRIKFGVQIASALSLCVGGLWIADMEHIFLIDAVPFWVGMPLTVLCVVYLTNAVNLIDGIDGLASGLSIISLFVITALNLLSENLIWAVLSASFMGAVMAFFYYNVFGHRYKVFMGDTGSLTLGFVLSFLVLHFWQKGMVWNPHMHNIGIVAISTLVIPLMDVVRVMMSRLRDHRNPFLPDKNHIHHKLLRTGMGGRMTTVCILLISIGFIVINYLVASHMSQTLMLLVDVVAYVVIQYVINFFIERKESADGIRWSREL